MNRLTCLLIVSAAFAAPAEARTLFDVPQELPPALEAVAEQTSHAGVSGEGTTGAAQRVAVHGGGDLYVVVERTGSGEVVSSTFERSGNRWQLTDRHAERGAARGAASSGENNLPRCTRASTTSSADETTRCELPRAPE